MPCLGGDGELAEGRGLVGLIKTESVLDEL